MPAKNRMPSRQPPRSWPPAANRITFPARTIFLQVDLQTDHEQHEDQAELGDDADRFLGLDPAHAEWTNEKAGDKVGQYQRLPGEMGEQPNSPGKQDTERDIANEFMHASKTSCCRNLEGRA